MEVKECVSVVVMVRDESIMVDVRFIISADIMEVSDTTVRDVRPTESESPARREDVVTNAEVDDELSESK